jgi:hypothetical protein
MRSRPSNLGGAALAALACGPIFVFCYIAATVVLMMPHPVPVDLAALARLPLTLILSMMIFGTVLGVVPCFLGATLMGFLSNAVEEARLPETWVGCGAAIGLGLSILLFNASMPKARFALTATAACCAWICWHNSGLAREGRTARSDGTR